MGLLSLDAPLAAVVHRRNAGHPEEDAISGPQMFFIGKHTGDTLYIVVVQEAQKMLPLIQCPVFRPELPGQRVPDLKEVHGVKTGPQALIALIVGHRMTGPVVHPAVIIPVEGLPHEDKVLLEAAGKFPQLPQIIRREAIGHVQTQAVNIELVHPGTDGVKLMPDHRGIVQIQLYQLIVPLPGLIPESVVIAGIAVEVNAEPVPVGAVPLFLLYVPERPEPPAHMVEHPVQHHPQPGFMEGVTDLPEVLISAQAAVQMEVVPRIVAVSVTVEKGIEEDRVRAGLLDMLHPVQYTENTMLLHAVVVLRRAAEAQRVDLIDDCFVKPHNIDDPFNYSA